MANHPIFNQDMIEIVDSFVVETREIFEALDNDLLQLENTPEDSELVDKIFRAVHTVKGTSGFLSLEQLSVLAHHFEDVLNKLRKHELNFTTEMLDVMLDAFDLMKVLLQQVVDQNIEPIDIDTTIARLNAISEGKTEQTPGPVPAATGENLEPDPESETAPSSQEAEDIQESQEVQDKPESNPTEESVAKEVEPASTDPEAPTKKQTGIGRKKMESATDTIRVEVSRLDNLMNLVGELVLSRNRLIQVIKDGHTVPNREDLLRDLSDTSAQLDFITTELQTAIMRTRMVQIGRVFNKFPRLVRDLAKEFNKQINLVIEGEETELDKSLIEEIGDPLVHLIRNSADHGIESPEKRRAAGKPEVGEIRLTAAHEGNHVVIVIEDDGAGMHPERLKEAAINKGIITPKEAAEMTDKEAYLLVFRAGFSTAKKVSQVSGRGVGMDVVKTNITRLNGTINIESEPGKGTKFTLKLPLTLAIIQGLLVKVADETFAIPLHSVIEVVSIARNEIDTIQGREILRLRNQVLPLIRIGESLGIEQNYDLERQFAVIVGIAHHQLGLMVDDLIGQKEVVIKPLGNYLKKVRGIAGSTILGDGRVIMIADVPEIVRMHNEKLNGTVLGSLQTA